MFEHIPVCLTHMLGIIVAVVVDGNQAITLPVVLVSHFAAKNPLVSIQLPFHNCPLSFLFCVSPYYIFLFGLLKLLPGKELVNKTGLQIYRGWITRESGQPTSAYFCRPVCITVSGTQPETVFRSLRSPDLAELGTPYITIVAIVYSQ